MLQRLGDLTAAIRDESAAINDDHAPALAEGRRGRAQFSPVCLAPIMSFLSSLLVKTKCTCGRC